MNHQLESSANRSSDSRLLSTRVSFYSRSSPSTLTLHLRLFKVHVRPGRKVSHRGERGRHTTSTSRWRRRGVRVGWPLRLSTLSCVGYLENLVGQGVVASRPAIRLTWHATNFLFPLPSPQRSVLAHSLRRTHSPPARLAPLLSSTALPFRLAANNTRNNSRCSTHLVLLALVPSVHKPVRSCS